MLKVSQFQYTWQVMFEFVDNELIAVLHHCLKISNLKESLTAIKHCSSISNCNIYLYLYNPLLVRLKIKNRRRKTQQLLLTSIVVPGLVKQELPHKTLCLQLLRYLNIHIFLLSLSGVARDVQPLFLLKCSVRIFESDLWMCQTEVLISH